MGGAACAPFLLTDLAGAALYVKLPAGATVVGAHADAPRAPSTAALVSVGPSAGGGFERLDLTAVGYGKSRVVVIFDG